eukprot:TRINITY_DN3740_c0_g5_i1.p1 TRINITY_DN3740_c0_g5~~TRINITY_DN3740_c0_g5_i1.p1  ORF type:complete len:451 (-),score=106.92 TRINITY_DN3740_c0_g5_i1:69-1256(-)
MALTTQPRKNQLYYLKNKQSIRDTQKQYRLHNKSAIKEMLHSYYLQHKEAICAKTKEYRANNRLTINQKQKQYRIQKRDLIKEKSKLYYRDNREAYQAYRRRNRLLIRGRLRDWYLRCREATDGERRKRKEEAKERREEERRKNMEAIVLARKEKQRIYKLNNKEKIREKQRLYYISRRKPRQYKVWNCPIRVREFLEYARERLFVSEPMDWYRISFVQMRKIGGARLYSIFGNLGGALQLAFPEVSWEQDKFSFRGKKSRQRWLKVILQQILPENTLIIEDYLHPELKWEEDSRYKMELDLWVPKFQMALEYQGEHHYHDLCSAYGPSGTMSFYQSRDWKKKESCYQGGITLIPIPYWWDGTKESLASTLFQIRPDIFPKSPFPQIPSTVQRIF